MLRQIIFQQEIKLYAFRNVTIIVIITYVISETILTVKHSQFVLIYTSVHSIYLYIKCNNYFFKTDFINNTYKMLDNILNNKS